MPWFRVDDTFAHHAKVMAAGNSAIGLWTRAGSWSMQQLTDGYVPDHVVKTIGTMAEAKRLVDVGLWLRIEDGYQFHQWEGRQPSREKVEADREAAAERQRHARERAKSQRESRRDKGVSHGPPDPTRPITTKNTGRPAGSGESLAYFDDFWAAYPRKESKGHARTAWLKAAKKTEPSVIIDAAMAFGRRVAGSDPKFVAHPATWLNGERWDDEEPTSSMATTDGWFQPWTPPIAPPEIADNPELYDVWIAEQRKADGR